jgi:hypothetical protein
MRKLSLDNGEYALEILPDFAGALSALRWTEHSGRVFNLLQPADEADLQSRNAGGLSLAPLAASGQKLEEPELWTVQDASNIRATLTWQNPQDHEGGALSYQILQRFELKPDGLKILLSLTNLGVQPMPAQIGLRLRPDWRGESRFRGDMAAISASTERLPGMAEFTAGLVLGRENRELCLGLLGPSADFIWPEDRLALTLSFISGFKFLVLEDAPQRREIHLSPYSHMPGSQNAAPAFSVLKQGDSLAANLQISAQKLEN